MSSNQSQPSGSPALGSRENFWGHEGSYESADRDPQGHIEKPGTDKLQWIATSILYRAQGATVVCPECYTEYELVNELSEPSEYVPSSVLSEDDEAQLQLGSGLSPARRAYTDHRRHRYCPSCGLVAWGGVLLDRPQELFVEIVCDVVAISELPPSTSKRVVSRADARKKRQWGDKTNLRRTLKEINHPESMDDGGVA